MIFPKSERVIFDKNPLEQVICQLRFLPILAIISKEPAEFQERVRATHPKYEKTITVMPKPIADLLATLPVAPNFPEAMVYKFTTVDGKSEIDLTRDFIAVATTKYRRWEEFEQTIRLAASNFEALYNPGSYTRIGLRYRNVIDRQVCGLDNVPWKELIRQSVVGLLAESEGEVSGQIRAMESQCQIDLDVDNEHVAIRNGLIGAAGENQKYAIDADFYAEGEITIGDVFSILGRFNEEARNLFNWTIAARLRKALGPIPVK